MSLQTAFRVQGWDVFRLEKLKVLDRVEVL